MMKRSILTGQRLVAVFLLGCVLFNYPIIALFNKPGEVFDIRCCISSCSVPGRC
jgi:hypothetical protein